MTTNTAARADSKFPVYEAVGQGALCIAHGTFTLTANPSANDVIEFCKVPKGATVVGGILMGGQIDTNVTQTFDMDIGWKANGVDSANASGFGDMGVLTGAVVTNMIPVAGIWRPLQGVLLSTGPQTFAEETTIIGTIIAAAATFASVPLTVVIFYHMGTN